jgi:hypothetical protein
MTMPAELRRHASLVWVAGLAFAVLLLITTDFAKGLSAGERAALEPLSTTDEAAWRGLGLGVIGLPVSAWDAPSWLVRLYFLVLSCLALVAAFQRWAWPAGKIAWTGALLFAASWVPLVSGGTAQPALFAGLAAVLTAGFAMRWCVERDRGALVGTAGGVALAAVFVPLAGVWLALGLVVVVSVWTRRQAAPGLLATALGVGVGLLPWLVESMVRFAGPLDRVRQGLGGPGSATVAQYLDVVDGPLVVTAAARPSVPAVAWVAVLAAMAATGILQRRWNHRRNAALVGVTLSTALVIPFAVITNHADGRLLLPAYGLLIVAVAAGVLDLWHVVGRRLGSPLVTVSLVLVTGAALVWQISLAVTHR